MASKVAGIQYVGHAGDTLSCVEAVKRFLQCNDHITKAKILTNENYHCFLLTLEEIDLVAIKSGFASGYAGQGPSGLSFVLQLLKVHGAEIDEYAVSPMMFRRVDESCLTVGDIDRIGKMRPVRPIRWHNYIVDQDWEAANDGTLWRDFPPVIPFSIVDTRIMDLALSFWEGADDRLLIAYRRLEDTIRKRTGLEEHGAKLYSQAFMPPDSRLTWQRVGAAEQIARANLFVGAFGAYRNPRAHRELTEGPDSQLAEFLLVNQLYRLEKEAKIQHPVAPAHKQDKKSSPEERERAGRAHRTT